MLLILRLRNISCLCSTHGSKPVLTPVIFLPFSPWWSCSWTGFANKSLYIIIPFLSLCGKFHLFWYIFFLIWKHSVCLVLWLLSQYVVLEIQPCWLRSSVYSFPLPTIFHCILISQCSYLFFCWWGIELFGAHMGELFEVINLVVDFLCHKICTFSNTWHCHG